MAAAAMTAAAADDDDAEVQWQKANKFFVDGAICLFHGELEMSTASLGETLRRQPDHAAAAALLRWADRCTAAGAGQPARLLAQTSAYFSLLEASGNKSPRAAAAGQQHSLLARTAAAAVAGAAAGQLQEMAGLLPDIAAGLLAAGWQAAGGGSPLRLAASGSGAATGGHRWRHGREATSTATVEQLNLARQCFEAAMKVSPACAAEAADGLERVEPALEPAAQGGDDSSAHGSGGGYAGWSSRLAMRAGRAISTAASAAASSAVQASAVVGGGSAEATVGWGWPELLADWERSRGGREACGLLADPSGAGCKALRRAEAWPVMAGNVLGITAEKYRQLAAGIVAGGGGIGATAAELAQIDVDLKRTLPAHGQLFSSPESPYRQALLELLTAYRRHNPDLGYKQGMTFVAAMLLLHTDGSGTCDGESNAAAFGCLANMVDGSPLLGLYSLRRAEVGRVAQLFAELLAAVDPPLAAHLGSGGLGLLENCCNLFLLDWVLTLWCKALPPSLAGWAWDNVLARGIGSAGRAKGGKGEEWGLWLSVSLLVALRSALLQATELEQAAGLLRATSVAHLFSKSRRVEESLPAECRELLGFVEPAEELIRIVTTAVARLEKGALPVVPAAAAPAVAGGDTADRLGAVASSSGGSHGGSMSWQSGGGGWRQPAVAAESDRDGGGGLSATIGGWGLLPSLSARTPAVHVLWRRYHEEWTLYSSEMRYGTQI